MDGILRKCVALVAVVLAALAARAAEVEFRVTIPSGMTDSTLSGRVVVYLVGAEAEIDRDTEPADGPFFDDPQPMYSVEISGARSGTEIVIASGQAGVAWFPTPLADLPPGTYRVQAVLDATRANSSWRREPGNLVSEVQTVQIGAEPITVELPLATRVAAERPRAAPGVEYVEIESRLLTEFRGERVVLRAGVLKPEGHLPSRRYPAIFEVPGFGGDHRGIVMDAMSRQVVPRSPLAARLDLAAFRIVLDPEGPSGHHLFADSACNGPVGRALVEELIPELTRRFGLIDAPEARLLRGHSSGGWSVIWLATEYPDVFGAAWSSSPDPVDFRRFQAVNIYDDQNMFERPTAGGAVEQTPSYTDARGLPRMTIREENRMEEVLGPGNTSGQQWDSWLAVFCPKSSTGNPTDLYHPETGSIDHTVAEAMRAYDIGERLRASPERYGPLLRDRVRLIVGDMDNYALDEAVGLLRSDLERLGYLGDGRTHPGYITIVPGLDHGSIFGSEAVRAIEQQMLDHLTRHADVVSRP